MLERFRCLSIMRYVFLLAVRSAEELCRRVNLYNPTSPTSPSDQSGNPLWTPGQRHCCVKLPSSQWYREARGNLVPRLSYPTVFPGHMDKTGNSAAFQVAVSKGIKTLWVMIRDTYLSNTPL